METANTHKGKRMGTITITPKRGRTKEKAELELLEEGTIRFEASEQTGRDSWEYLIKHEGGEIRFDLGIFPWAMETPELHAIRHFIKHGYEAYMEDWKNHSFTIRYKKATKEALDTLDKLREIEGSSRNALGFKSFNKFDGKTIEAEFFGHKVAGSYVHDWEMTPGYIERLQKATGRKVEWTGRKTGGWTSDMYTFKIDLTDQEAQPRQD